tara:strand:- start:11 stop:367 length:357 start_codon:yes stop_codon:yes gene_type:complete
MDGLPKNTVNDDTSLGINLKWLIQIVIAAGMIVWGYFSLTSRIAQLEIDALRSKDSVIMNSEFRVKWPLGQLGALPDDAEQNMRLGFIEKSVIKLESHVDDLRIETKRQEIQNQHKHP